MAGSGHEKTHISFKHNSIIKENTQKNTKESHGNLQNIVPSENSAVVDESLFGIDWGWKVYPSAVK